MSRLSGKILRIGIDSPVKRVYPRDSDGYTAQLVCRQIFEPPFDTPTAGHASRPLLFSGPLRNQSSDPDESPVLSATLREGLCLSDGSPVTAKDVVASLADLEQAGQASVSARGNTIRFALKRPNANFHLALTQTYWALGGRRGERLLGSGAFRMLDESTDNHVLLERNPYFRRDVALDGLEFRVYPADAEGSRQALAEALDRGEIDLTMSLGQKDVAALGKLRKWFDPGSSTCNLYFNCLKPPLSNPDVRRALAMSINRLDLSAAVYGNALAFAAKGPLPPVMGEWLDSLTYDVDAARGLLAALGHPLPAVMRLLMPWAPRPYVPNPQAIAAQLDIMFARLGVALERVETRDLADFRRHIIEDAYDLALLGWNADSPDPADFLDASLASSAIPDCVSAPVVKANWSRWSSPAMDQALAGFRADPDDISRSDHLRILKLLSEQVPLLPLIHGPTFSVHSYRVRNFEPSPFGIPDLSEVDLWL